MDTICLNISNNNVDISNNKYIINNNNIVNISYGLYINDGSYSQPYYLENISRNAPLRFFIDGSHNNNSGNDISHIIEVSYNGPIIPIYVSKGNDLSFNNGDYFRFYDGSFNLININHNSIVTTLTNSSDNFYFMNDVSYRFIASIDFSSDFVFSISGALIDDNSLTLFDDSFIINIPSESNNVDNKIFYIDLCNEFISEQLVIAIDDSNNKYYYDNIRFTIKSEISNNDISLSIISINKDISNINFFKYDETCNYIIDNTNIIANELSKRNKECLNIISKADFSSNISSYEFNVGNHFTNNKNKDLSYVIYDGTYYIIDICINYPLKVNNDSSDILIIDSNYTYTLETENKYYYNAIKLIVNPSDITIQNDRLFSLQLSDTSYITFIYSDQCTNPDSVNVIRDRSEFILINQYYTEFSDNYYEDVENHYSLNIYEKYIEPSNIYGFIATDKYGHDLKNLVDTNRPEDLSSILTRTNNYDISNFLISYILTTYDEESYELYRFVKINYGPFIEISGLPLYYYKDDNSFNNVINISNNLDSPLPFDLSNIIVYLKNGINDRINLKFDVEFLNNAEQRYSINSTNKNPIFDSNYSILDISYNKKVIFPNSEISGEKYYLSRNLLHFNYANVNSGNNNLFITGSTNINQNPLVLKDISNISVSTDNSNNKILNDEFILSFFDQDFFLKNNSKKYIDYSNIYLNDPNYSFLTLYSKDPEGTFDVCNIQQNISHPYLSLDESFGLIEITQNDSSNNLIHTKLYLNNTNFIIDFSFIDTDLSDNNITISGEFLSSKIFSNSTIDLSYIGNYQIKIVPLGLNSNDNFYSTISDISFSSDISKIYTINVIDETKPIIQFKNTGFDSSFYTFDFPRDSSFQLIPTTNNFDISNSLFFLSDACYTDFIDLNRENSSKPIIVFNDDSIYNVDLSYVNVNIYDVCNIKLPIINNVLDVSNKNQDASAIVNYFGIDLYGNKSSNISLTILFKNIPQLTLSGEIIFDLEVGDSYIEPGIFIDNTLYNFDNLTLTGPFIDFCINKVLGSKQYDISFITDLNINQVGLYDISYIVSFSDDTTTTFLKRFIKVKDNTPPFILFPDLSLINYDFSSRNTNDISNTLSSLSDISYAIDNSSSIIDFSLSLFSNISDLSKIINYYNLSDNYTSHIEDISVSISLEIISITGDISSIDFKQDLNNIITFLSGYGYINADGSFIILTQSSDYDKDLSYSYYKPELSFNYIINDICDNSFNFTRKVNIINYDISPNIFFTKNSSAIDNLSISNIVEYDISKIDFSYQAISYKKNPKLFIDEISNILFNFDISDQFSKLYNEINLNSNILISISYNDLSYSDPSIIRFNDLSNLNVDSFNTISNNSFYLDISNILKQFAIIDNSFQLIYDFSNNQNLINRQIRNVTIINTISCDISVSFEFAETTANTINISFGNTDFSFTKFFTLSHPRLEDISFELSYNPTPLDFSSIIGGDVSFDVSALIYQYTDSSNIKSYNFSFYNTINNDSTFDSSTIDISINIIIDPPSLKDVSSLSTITHPAGTYISDLSLIENVSFFSKFDEFYYNNPNNAISISYSETNFTLIIEESETTTSEFNQNFPISDLSGDAIYNIIYHVSDANDISRSFNRSLIIQDTTSPIITLLNQDHIDVEDFLEIKTFDILGFNVQDSFSYLKTIDYSVNVIIDSSLIRTLDICNISFNLTSSDISNNYDISIIYILNFNDISDLVNDFSDIIIETSYKVSDIKDNSADTSNSITLNFSDLIKLNIAIIYNDNYFDLSDDFYIPSITDWFLKYNHSSETITYNASINDISFNVSVDSSNQDISTNIALNNSVQIIPSINDICFTDICNIDLYFQLFYIPNNGGNPIIKTRILNLNIVDKSPPDLSFINNNTEIFPNINIIKLPEVSYNFIFDNSSNNFNLFYDEDKSYNYFIKNVSNEIIYNIPSIIITDIANGLRQLPSNINDISIISSLKTNATYDISISYKQSNIDFSSSALLGISGNFIQTFQVTENYANTDFSINTKDISRTIIIERFPPIIELSYNKGYIKSYHKHYSLYNDLSGIAIDYVDGFDISLQTIKTNFNENNLGLQKIEYKAQNNNIINNIRQRSRDVHVVDICCLFFDKTENYDISNISNDFDNNIRYGLYGTQTNELSYNFYIDPLSNFYIALKSYKNDIDITIDNSNAISINYDQIYNHSPNNVFYNPFDHCSYVKGNVIINVKEDFDRASLHWITIDSSNNIDNSDNFLDLFLYHDSCRYYFVDSSFIDISIDDFIEFSVDVSGNNNIHNTNVPYFTISGNNGLSNELTFDPTPRKTLHLPFGIYGFKQNRFRNFYNKIKFSYLPDGCHFNIKDNSNGDISYIYNDFLLYNNYTNVKDISFNNKNDPSYSIYEYTNNVYSNSLAGINKNSKNSYTYLEINATTPSPLYYYSENFSNMGGIIYTKNNINFSKNCVSLNGNILSINNNNENIFNHSDFSSTITNFNEISSNLLFLSCRFDLSSNNTSEINNIILNKDFIALTQQNITHNIIINKDSNRIIFKKYDDISSITNGYSSDVYESINYIIKQDNSNNYLFDSSINFIERYKGNNILLYKFNIETSANFIKNNLINNRLELNALDFFFNNNQLNNYENFFNKNKLINNIYEKNNNNKNIYFTQDAFKYNINEIAYINQVNLKNGDHDYKFFDNTDLLNSNRLIFEPIFDNLFTFNFQIYLDYNNVSLDPIYKNYLKNNIFNKNIYSNYPNDINVDYLYFDELIVSVVSDISGPSTITKHLSQSIIFSENTIFINEPFLNSTNNKNTIDIALNGISSENLIILSGIDDYNNNTFCGLTQQNFVHNIDISNVNKVIFHKYNSTLFNYQVNNANLTLEKTLLDSSNNNKYLLELSSNDVYNCFIDISQNITNTRNLVNKNKLMESSINILVDPNFSFNSHITYTIYDEIESNNSYLSNFDIRPVNLYQVNELSYNNDISYAYANYNNISNSHSFIINLTDYLDRKFFDNIKINIPSNIINYNNINFIIKDISYSDQTKQFNLYDICGNQIILYDKTKIATLNDLEAKIHITNLKFEYLKEVYEVRHGNSETLTQLINNQSNFINTLNLQNIVTLFNTTGFITNTYAIELENNSLNRLYSNVFYNSKLLINRYNQFIDAFNFYDYYLLPITSNIYDNIRDFELVNQLVTDISQINFNIYKINQEIEIRTSQDIYNTIQNDICLNRLHNYETLLKLTQFYLDYKQRYEIIHYELTLRHDIFTNIDNNLNESNNYDSSFVELFNTYTINAYYKILINNMINFNDMLLNDISSSVIYNSTEGQEDSSSNIYHNTLTTNTKYNPPDISYLEILAYEDISINFNIILNSAELNYDFINKESIFDNINYVLNGTSILINSFQSSNILFKIDLIYNSYLFPNKYLDTLILDVVKPDLIPPTIIFNNNDLTINQADLQSNIDNIIQTLIRDISYIELHESHRDFNVNDISYTYSKVGGDIFYNTTSLIQSNVTIEIDISNIGTNTSDNLEVIYKVIDNANNINIIKRNITFITSINSPNLYYVNPLILPPNINNKINPGSYELPILTVNENLNTNIIIELAKNNIIIQDSSSTIYLTKEDPSFDLMLDITILDASNIRYDLSSLIFPSIQPLVFNRLISTTSEIIEEQKDHCCFPPAFYYPIQHNYTLGQNATYKMRMARFIINNHR